jgi:hypothetical protein
MKTNNMLVLGLIALLGAMSAGSSMAYDHDNKGWYDSNHHRHAFISHNHHRGYWDHDKSGAKIFINVD